MRPRIQLFSVQRSSVSSPTSIPSFLLPFLHSPSQVRRASILSSLSDTPGSYHKKIRRGRGPSSGKGKTAGRGTKGQKQHGGVPAGFEGGQTPDHVVHGKEGFNNVHSLEMSPVNLDTIQTWISAGRLNPSLPITLRELCASRAIHGIKDGVKLLARGATSLTTPIHLVVSRASQSAIAAVEALGGSVTTRFYTKLAIRRIKMGEMNPYVSLKWDQEAIAKPVLNMEVASTPEARAKGAGFPYRLPDPTSRKDMEYYRDPKNRGYLAHTVKEGEGPSLYFKPPKVGLQQKSGAAKSKQKAREENRLW